MAKWKIVTSDIPIEEGKPLPIIAIADREAERLGGRVLDYQVSSAMIKYEEQYA